MKIRFLILLMLTLNVQNSFTQVPADISDTQQAIDSVERIVEESEKEDDDGDLVGITLEDTLQSAVVSGVMAAGSTYGYLAFSDRNFKAFAPTELNAKLFGSLFASGAGGTLVYGGLRAVTKEFTGYDAMPIVQYSTQAVAQQTIACYAVPVPYDERIKLFSTNQVASYVATDLTVAASMYAYKEATGKKLACPKLPIPDELRDRGFNEKVVGGFICMGVKYVMRTYVMDKLCGVPVAV